MTFYDNHYEAALPNLPAYEFVLDDSPTCHQSLKYWTDRADEVRNKPYWTSVHCVSTLYFTEKRPILLVCDLPINTLGLYIP